MIIGSRAVRDAAATCTWTRVTSYGNGSSGCFRSRAKRAIRENCAENPTPCVTQRQQQRRLLSSRDNDTNKGHGRIHSRVHGCLQGRVYKVWYIAVDPVHVCTMYIHTHMWSDSTCTSHARAWWTHWKANTASYFCLACLNAASLAGAQLSSRNWCGVFMKSNCCNTTINSRQNQQMYECQF